MHRSRFPSTVLALGATLACLAGASELRAQRGFSIAEGVELKFKPPPKWVYLGSDGDRGSLRSMFAAPRSYSPKVGRSAPHTPTLRVLWFPTQKAEDASAAKAGNGKGDDKNNGQADFPRKTPYTSFKDYLDRSHGRQTKILTVEPGAFGKFEGRRTVVQVGEGSTSLTLHTCVTKLEGGELAVEFEVLGEQYAKMKGQFEKCLDTFAPVPADKVKPRPMSGTPMWETDFEGWRSLPAAERNKKRKEYGDRILEAAKSRNEPKFKPQNTKHFLVLSRTDSKFTKRIVQAAELAREWAESRFDKVSDDVVVPAVLRIYDSREEMNAYRLREDNPKEYHPGRREIYAFKNASIGNLGDGYGDVIRGVFQQFIHDKHPLIFDNLPRWLDSGLWSYMDSSRVVGGKKLIFFPSDVEMGRFKIHADRGNKQKTWWFIQEKMVETPKDGGEEEPWGYAPESVRMLRWLEEGGNEIFKKSDFLVAYLAQIGATAEKFRPRPDKNIDWFFMEDSQTTELRKQVYARRGEFLEKVNYTVIPIPVEDWKKADELWQAFNEEFAKRKFKKK